jgi:hypothetical protein
MATIPVCSQSGKTLARLSPALAQELKGVELVRDRHGRVKRVMLKPVTNQLRPVLSKLGSVFQQELPDGHVCFAFRGVEGSR